MQPWKNKKRENQTIYEETSKKQYKMLSAFLNHLKAESDAKWADFVELSKAQFGFKQFRFRWKNHFNHNQKVEKTRGESSLTII